MIQNEQTKRNIEMTADVAEVILEAADAAEEVTEAAGGFLSEILDSLDDLPIAAIAAAVAGIAAAIGGIMVAVRKLGKKNREEK